jgi:hypothetical protein
VLEDIHNLVVDALVPLRRLRRLVDVFRFDAAPEQRTGRRVVEINRQRAAELLVYITPVPPSPARTVESVVISPHA